MSLKRIASQEKPHRSLSACSLIGHSLFQQGQQHKNKIYFAVIYQNLGTCTCYWSNSPPNTTNLLDLSQYCWIGCASIKQGYHRGCYILPPLQIGCFIACYMCFSKSHILNSSSLHEPDDFISTSLLS